MADKQSLYELLGLTDKASPEEIHNAHEALRRTLDAQPDSPLTGVVERIEASSTTERTHRLYRVRVRLNSLPPWVLPGLGGRAEIKVGRLPVSEKLWRWMKSWLRQDLI